MFTILNSLINYMAHDHSTAAEYNGHTTNVLLFHKNSNSLKNHVGLDGTLESNSGAK